MMTVSPALNGKLRANPQPVKRFWIERLNLVWNAVWNNLIPMGYEDQSGFHYGLESSLAMTQSPPHHHPATQSPDPEDRQAHAFR